jgi:hypothetical protein
VHKDNRTAESPVRSDPTKAADRAEQVHRNFTALLRVFEEQLASASSDDSLQRSPIAEAKAAAERGLKLSEQLIEMLRTRS